MPHVDGSGQFSVIVHRYLHLLTYTVIILYMLAWRSVVILSTNKVVDQALVSLGVWLSIGSFFERFMIPAVRLTRYLKYVKQDHASMG